MNNLFPNLVVFNLQGPNTSGNVTVVARFRPLNESEKAKGAETCVEFMGHDPKKCKILLPQVSSVVFFMIYVVFVL